jgi:hypothetical protein
MNRENTKYSQTGYNERHGTAYFVRYSRYS